MSEHTIVHYDPGAWVAVPANNGGNGPIWQWGDELLIGFTKGTFLAAERGHQCTYDRPFESWLARSRDGGESWTVWKPEDYAGKGNPAPVTSLEHGVDFTAEGFAMRVEGTGYHGNEAARWFASLDRGASWKGPYGFGSMLEHPELAGKEFTSRTAYLPDSGNDMLMFFTARDKNVPESLKVIIAEKTFVAAARDGGTAFEFVSWAVPWVDPYRAAMPAPVRISATTLLVATRRKSKEHNWIDCYVSHDNGASWEFASKLGDTEDGNRHNGNPPALIVMSDGRLCGVYGNRSRQQMLARFSDDQGASWTEPLVIRDGFRSVNGYPDLGYPRVFQRTDGRLVATYFWCTEEKPQTHVAATVFDAP